MSHKLHRSEKNKVVAGIFGGLEEVTGVDANILRLMYVFIGVGTGVLPALITYLIGAVIIPLEVEAPSVHKDKEEK